MSIAHGSTPAWANPSSNSLPSTAPAVKGAWITVKGTDKKPVVGAAVTLGGKPVGQTDSQGFVFVGQKLLFHHALALAIQHKGYQTHRQSWRAKARPKTERSHALAVILHRIPIRLGSQPLAAQGNTNSSESGVAAAKSQTQQLTSQKIDRTQPKVGKTVAANLGPKALAKTEANEVLEPEPLSNTLIDLGSEPSQGGSITKKALRPSPAAKRRATEVQPSLKIMLIYKPAPPMKKSTKKKKAKPVAQDTVAQGQVFDGVVGRLDYATPKGKTEYCDLSLGWCQFPLGKGIKPARLTLTGQGFETKALPIRSTKSQTVLVSLSPNSKVPATKKARKSRRSHRQKAVAKGKPEALRAYTTRYSALQPVTKPQLMAKDGVLSKVEVHQLMTMGTTSPAKAARPKKPKRAKKTSNAGNPPLTWADVHVVAPGQIALRDAPHRAREQKPLAFAAKAYQPPRVSLVTLAGRQGSKDWLTGIAAAEAKLGQTPYINWQSSTELKAQLSAEGRSLLTWLTSDASQPGASDYVVVLAPLQSYQKNNDYLALLRHSSGRTVAAHVFGAKEPVAEAIATMVDHIPLEIIAVGSKDGDVALNMPKSLFTRIFGSKNADDNQHPRLPLYRQEGTPIALEPLASYPRLTYVSPLTKLTKTQKSSRIRVGQRFTANLGRYAIAAPSPLIADSKRKSTKRSSGQDWQFKSTAGSLLPFTLIWTKDGKMLSADALGRLPQPPAVADVTGAFHPSFGATNLGSGSLGSGSLGSGALKVATRAGRNKPLAATVSAPPLLEWLTTPVSAQVTLGGKELGTSPVTYSEIASQKIESASIDLKIEPREGSPSGAFTRVHTTIKPSSLKRLSSTPIVLTPDHGRRIEALMAKERYKEAERMIAALPKSQRNNVAIQHLRGTIAMAQQDYRACHAIYKSLGARKRVSAETRIGAALNESICLSHLMTGSKRVKKTTLRHALASLKRAGKLAKANAQHRAKLATVTFYGSHLKYLHWHATKDKSYLDAAVRGYRYYLAMPPAQRAADNQRPSYKVLAKKVIAMVEK